MGWDDTLPNDAEARANIERAAEAWRESARAAIRRWDPAAAFGAHRRFGRSLERGRAPTVRANVGRWSGDWSGISKGHFHCGRAWHTVPLPGEALDRTQKVGGMPKQLARRLAARKRPVYLDRE
jgi:hypothetical protein